MKSKSAAILGAALVLAAAGMVTACQNAKVLAFEDKAAPVIQKGCADLHAAEASLAARIAVKAVEVGVGIAFGGAAGDIATGVANGVRTYGDAFCANGPPLGDKSSVADQAAWLAGIIQGVK